MSVHAILDFMMMEVLNLVRPAIILVKHVLLVISLINVTTAKQLIKGINLYFKIFFLFFINLFSNFKFLKI